MKKENENAEKGLVQVEQEAKVIAPIVKRCMDIQVKSDDDMVNANKGLTLVKQNKDRIEAVRVSLVKPLNDHVKFINDQFKSITYKLDEAKTILETKMLQYRREVQAKIDAENKRIEAENAKRQEEYEARLEKAKKPERVKAPELELTTMGQPTNKVDNSSFKNVWVFEVQDATKVPVIFKIVDEGKIKDQVRLAVQEERIENLVIPGIRIYQKEVISTSRGSL